MISLALFLVSFVLGQEENLLVLTEGKTHKLTCCHYYQLVNIPKDGSKYLVGTEDDRDDPDPNTEGI